MVWFAPEQLSTLPIVQCDFKSDGLVVVHRGYEAFQCLMLNVILLHSVKTQVHTYTFSQFSERVTESKLNLFKA